VTRQYKAIFLLAALPAIAVIVLLTWCPPGVCRALNIQTHTITRLDEYRQFLADEVAFHTRHHVRAVRLDCPALRQDVVATLADGRLILDVNKPSMDEQNSAPSGQVRAWHEGRVLHLDSAMPGSQREMDAWVARVRGIISEQQHDGLAFLPRLFGGVIIHIQKKQLPIVLFSDKPCA
jgi:hypothetical protein